MINGKVVAKLIISKEVKKEKDIITWKLIQNFKGLPRGVFRTQFNINNEAFFVKLVKGKSRYLLS